MSEITSTPQPAPEHPAAGGSYTRDPETGELTLQHQTLLVAPEPPAVPEANADAPQE